MIIRHDYRHENGMAWHGMNDYYHGITIIIMITTSRRHNQ